MCWGQYWVLLTCLNVILTEDKSQASMSLLGWSSKMHIDQNVSLQLLLCYITGHSVCSLVVYALEPSKFLPESISASSIPTSYIPTLKKKKKHGKRGKDCAECRCTYHLQMLICILTLLFESLFWYFLVCWYPFFSIYLIVVDFLYTLVLLVQFFWNKHFMLDYRVVQHKMLKKITFRV